MKHAYLIIAHNEWEILRTLLTMLDDDRNDIYLHIDRRATALMQQVDGLRLCHSPIHRIQQPIETRWGNFSQVETELLLFEAALRNGPYAYYHLLSGVDLPLKSQDEIHQFFEENSELEFVEYLPEDVHAKECRKRTMFYYVFNDQKKRQKDTRQALLTLNRNIILGLQNALHIHRKPIASIRKGSNWVSITQGFCEYLISQQHSPAIRRFRYTLCPDELFVQTLLMASPFKDHIAQIAGGNARKIDWQRGSPYTWQDGDFEELINSDRLFARKFSSADSRIIQRIYQHIMGETHDAKFCHTNTTIEKRNIDS